MLFWVLLNLLFYLCMFKILIDIFWISRLVLVVLILKIGDKLKRVIYKFVY